MTDAEKNQAFALYSEMQKYRQMLRKLVPLLEDARDANETGHHSIALERITWALADISKGITR